MNNSLSKNSKQANNGHILMTRKKIWSIAVKVFVILILLVGMGYAGYFTGDALRYDTKLGIEYTGGYQIQANVFDYTKDKGVVDYDKPNGDSKQGLKILQNKLDPIGDQPISLETYSSHTVAVRVSQSMYKSESEFANAVNRMGAIFILADGPDADTDLLLSKKTDDQHVTKYSRTQIHDVFTGVTSTIDRNRMPVVQLDKNSNGQWDKLVESQKDKNNKIWFWSDLGQLIDSLRNDFTNYSVNDYQNAEDAYHSILNKWLVVTKNAGAEQSQMQYKLFDYKGIDKDGLDFSGNFLRDGSSAFNDEMFKKIKTAKSFTWIVSSDSLMVNPNETEPQTDEINYVLPFEPYARQFMDSSMNQDVVKIVKSYVFNYGAVNNANYQEAAGNVFSVKSQTESLKIANLIRGGLSGIVLQSVSVQNINAVISSTALKALEIVLSVILIIAAVVLIFYERLYGILVVITFVSSIFMVLYILALLNVQIAPITIAAIVVGFALVLFGLFVMIKRYRDEKVTNQLPIVTSIKIAIKQTLPMFVDAIVLFLVLGLSLFWAGAGEIKAFAIALLITLFISIVLMMCLYLLFLYLFISIGTLDRVKMLDINHFSLKAWWSKKHPGTLSFNNKVADDITSDHDLLQIKKSDLSLNANYEGVSASMVEAPVNNATAGVKAKVVKTRRHLNMYDYAKWSPIVAIILIVVALAVAFSGVANFDQTIREGSVFTINQNVFPRPDGDETVAQQANKEIALINKELYSSDSGKPFRNYDMQMSINAPVSTQNDNYSVIVWTNITDKHVGNKFKSWLLSIGEGGIETDDVTVHSTDPVIANELMVMIIIALAIALIFVFIYTFFRLDWVQFISIFGSAILAVAVCLSIAIIVHLSITFSMIVVFGAIYCFAIVTSTLIMSKAKQKKKLFNLIDYDEFFNYEYNHRKSVKMIRRQIHYLSSKQVNARAKLLRAEDEYLTKYESIKLAKSEILQDRTNLEASAKMARSEYKAQRKEFKSYNHKHNFLYKAASMTVRDLLSVSVLMSIILIVVCIFLAAFGGTSFGFFIVLLIGIALAIWTPFLVAIPIWVILEKYRALNRVRVNNFLDSQRVELDEQMVVGIND